jgi:hypothetical protein
MYLLKARPYAPLLIFIILISSIMSCTRDQSPRADLSLLDDIPAETSYVAQITYQNDHPQLRAWLNTIKTQAPIYRKLLGAQPTRQVLVSLLEGFAHYALRGELEQVGLYSSFEGALYGAWLWPVYSQEVSDPELLLKWVKKIARRHHVELKERMFEGVKIYSAPLTSADESLALKFLLMFPDPHRVTVSIVTPALEDELLTSLNQPLPQERSMSSTQRFT